MPVYTIQLKEEISFDMGWKYMCSRFQVTVVRNNSNSVVLVLIVGYMIFEVFNR